ncbi:MAG: response regulator [Planctomycetota bacterium]|nr:response regulator [Planctomycetota bacterium]
MEIAQRPIEILLVEDSPTDILMTTESFKQGKLSNNMHVVTDGEAALAFLRREAPYEQKPRPDLVLLDLNLPRKDGREVLREIKSDESLRSIPVVVLTTSTEEEDVLRAYGLHANCYIAKPVSLQAFIGVVQSIQNFWFSVVLLPR